MARRSSAVRRAGLMAAVLGALLAGFMATDALQTAHAVADAGPALARLLRAMAAMKAVAAVGLAAAVVWRLSLPAVGWRLAAYGLACAAMAAGPGLVWGMAHVRLGALLLHGGLLTTILLLWRDPAMAVLLQSAVTSRMRLAQVAKAG